MTPLPKRKQSKGRTRRRRAHDALKPTKLVACQTCREMHRPHHVCPSCGSYAGVTVLEVENE
jgi:large subunit ribosomal protein L32